MFLNLPKELNNFINCDTFQFGIIWYTRITSELICWFQADQTIFNSSSCFIKLTVFMWIGFFPKLISVLFPKNGPNENSKNTFYPNIAILINLDQSWSQSWSQSSWASLRRSKIKPGEACSIFSNWLSKLDIQIKHSSLEIVKG